MSYEPESYWSERLSGEFTLKGVGHTDYSVAYNRWLYRQKSRVLDKALRGVPLGSHALDIGSGVGWVVDQLYHHGFQVDGVDIADVAVENLRKQFPNSTFERVTLGTDPLPFADESYDVVTMIDVAYHITDDEQFRAAVAEMMRVVKPGGVLVATDLMWIFKQPHQSGAAHVNFRHYGAWITAITDAGYRPEGAQLGPLFRWLSRPTTNRVLRRVPGFVRGPIEYGLESLGGLSEADSDVSLNPFNREPFLRYAVFRKLP